MLPSWLECLSVSKKDKQAAHDIWINNEPFSQNLSRPTLYALAQIIMVRNCKKANQKIKKIKSLISCHNKDSNTEEITAEQITVMDITISMFLDSKDSSSLFLEIKEKLGKINPKSWNPVIFSLMVQYYMAKAYKNYKEVVSIYENYWESSYNGTKGALFSLIDQQYIKAKSKVLYKKCIELLNKKEKITGLFTEYTKLKTKIGNYVSTGMNVDPTECDHIIAKGAYLFNDDAELEKNKTNLEYLIYYIKSAYRAGNHSEVEKELSEHIPCQNTKITSLLFLFKADICFKQKDYTTAANYYNEALNGDIGNSLKNYAHFASGKSLYHLKNYKPAESHFNQIKHEKMGIKYKLYPKYKYSIMLSIDPAKFSNRVSKKIAHPKNSKKSRIEEYVSQNPIVKLITALNEANNNESADVLKSVMNDKYTFPNKYIEYMGGLLTENKFCFPPIEKKNKSYPDMLFHAILHSFAKHSAVVDEKSTSLNLHYRHAIDKHYKYLTWLYQKNNRKESNIPSFISYSKLLSFAYIEAKSEGVSYSSYPDDCKILLRKIYPSNINEIDDIFHENRW